VRPYIKEDWYKTKVKKYIEKYGDVPPPWIVNPDSHPQSLRWRMGEGETLIMILGAWFETEFNDEEERINYFRKYPAPPRWLPWMAGVIWNLEPWQQEKFDYEPYFNKLRKLGFEGTSDFQKDFYDEQWALKETEESKKINFRRTKSKVDLKLEYAQLWKLYKKKWLSVVIALIICLILYLLSLQIK